MRVSAIALVVVVGVGAILGARRAEESRARENEEAIFRRVVDRAESRLQSELGRFEDLLLATAGAVRMGADQAAFSALVTSVDLHGRYPGSFGLAYIVREPGPPERAVLQFVEPGPSRMKCACLASPS